MTQKWRLLSLLKEKNMRLLHQGKTHLIIASKATRLFIFSVQTCTDFKR